MTHPTFNCFFKGANGGTLGTRITGKMPAPPANSQGKPWGIRHPRYQVPMIFTTRKGANDGTLGTRASLAPARYHFRFVRPDAGQHTLGTRASLAPARYPALKGWAIKFCPLKGDKLE